MRNKNGMILRGFYKKYKAFRGRNIKSLELLSIADKKERDYNKNIDKMHIRIAVSAKECAKCAIYERIVN